MYDGDGYSLMADYNAWLPASVPKRARAPYSARAG